MSMLQGLLALACCHSSATGAAAPRYLLSRAEPYTAPGDGTVMRRYDLWWIGPSRHISAPRSVQRALLTPQANPGSCYHHGKSA